MHYMHSVAPMQVEAWVHDQPYVPPEDSLSSSYQSPPLPPSMLAHYDSPEPSESGSSHWSLDLAPDMSHYHVPNFNVADAFNSTFGDLSFNDTLHEYEYNTYPNSMLNADAYDASYTQPREYLYHHGLVCVAAETPTTTTIPLAPEPTYTPDPLPEPSYTPQHAHETTTLSPDALRAYTMSPISHFSSDIESYTTDRPKQARKARRRTSRKSPYASPHTSPPSSPPALSSPSGRRVTHIRSRNTQVAAMPTDIDVSTGKCPVEGCCYVQAKGRSPDFKRHLATHTAALVPDKWICCGLPIQDARERGVHVSRDTVPREYEGIPMVGGCGQRFSRQDALKRHLDQGKGCIGKVDAPYLRGNQEKSAEKKSR